MMIHKEKEEEPKEISIKIIAQDNNQNKNVDDHWNIIVYQYLMTEIFLGLMLAITGNDGKKNPLMYTFIVIHYIFEMQVVLNILLKTSTAKLLFRILSAAIIIVAIPDIWIFRSYHTFGIGLVSDSMLLLTVMFVVLHPLSTNNTRRAFGALLIHSLLVAYLLAVIAIRRVYDANRDFTWGWILLGLSHLIQIYLLKPFISNKEMLTVPTFSNLRKMKCILLCLCYFSVYAFIFIYWKGIKSDYLYIHPNELTRQLMTCLVFVVQIFCIAYVVYLKYKVKKINTMSPRHPTL